MNFTVHTACCLLDLNTTGWAAKQQNFLRKRNPIQRTSAESPPHTPHFPSNSPFSHVLAALPTTHAVMSTLLLLYCTDEDNTKSSQCLNSAWEARNTCWQGAGYHRCHGPARSASPQEAEKLGNFTGMRLNQK